MFDWRIYLADPSQIFTISTLQAAGVYQGGLLLALDRSPSVYMRRNGLPGWLTADVFAPGLGVGTCDRAAWAVLRRDAAGAPMCHRPWAITFNKPDAHELTGVPLGVPLHPTQLYESLAEFAIFAVLVPPVSRNEVATGRFWVGISLCTPRFVLWLSFSAIMSRRWSRGCH